MKIIKTLASAAILVSFAAGAQAGAIYTTSQESGYGLSGMTTMKGFLTAGNTLTTGVDFSNAANLNNYQALWLNDRFSAASVAEVSAVIQFINSGKKVVFITDNNGWAAWNNSIESILGATITDTCASTNGTAVVNNTLTNGAGTLYSATCNSLLVPGPNAQMLYSNNMAGLYTMGAGQALVVTSVDVLSNGGLAQNNQFGRNVATWIGQPVNRVPEPSSLLLLGVGLLAVAARRRRA